MVAKRCDDATFVELFETIGPNELARRLDINPASLFKRRVNLERKLGRQIVAPDKMRSTRVAAAHPPWHQIHIPDGVVLIGSDAHYWPDQISTAHKAFVKFCQRMKPKAVIMNGDVFDGARVSRHPPIGWEQRPSVIEELEACKARLAEIRKAAKTSDHFIWTLGNHDGRFETRLATVASEYARVHGFHLKDHFPDWTPTWLALINDNTVVKHRYKGGKHAGMNNTLWSGKHIFTGHDHMGKAYPLADYRGLRWGGHCGTLADPYGPQFVDYCEGNPVDWHSGFPVLTYRGGELLEPEYVRVWSPNVVAFRGELIEVA